MTIDTQTVVARSSTVAALDPTSFDLTLDEGWSPYAQATLEVPYTADAATATDPTTDARVTGTLVQDFGASDTVAALTAQFSGGTVATVTAAWHGLFVRDITAMHNRPWNDGVILPSRRRPFDMLIRSRTIDHAARTIRLTLASDESLLQDYALVANISYQPATTSVRAIVAYVLAKIGRVLHPGTDDGVIEASSAEWLPGVAGWDYLTPLLQTAALRLWCDERRRWYLTSDTASQSTEGLMPLSYLGTVTGADDVIDRDGDWFDAVVCVYVWTDAAGVRRRAYDTAETPGFTRVRTFEFETPYPGPGAAARLLERALGRGREQTLDAVSDFTAEPGRPVSVTMPDLDIQSGYVASVSWSLPSSSMRVKTRGLVGTPWYAWILDPPGVSWNSIPVGTDWSEDI